MYKLRSVPVQAGDISRVVRWGDHSLLGGNSIAAIPAPQAAPAKPLPPASAFVGILKQLLNR